MSRFVLLEHDHPFLHWDLMLESGAVLRTWRLLSPPGSGEGRAESSFDHRLVYLSYEGPVSGNRGTVRRWDSGEFAWQQDQPDRVQVQLNGTRLRGLLELQRQVDGDWTVRWQPLD